MSLAVLSAHRIGSILLCWLTQIPLPTAEDAEIC